MPRNVKKWQKSTKSGKKIKKSRTSPEIVAKHKGIPYPVHRGKYRESQVAKVTKSGDSEKHRYSLDDTKFRKVQRSVLKLWKTWISKTEPRAKTPIQSAPRKRSKNGNSPETAKYQESTPASRIYPKCIVRLATDTDIRGDVPTQSWPAQYLHIYFTQV